MKILAGQHGGQSSAFLIARKKREFRRQEEMERRRLREEREAAEAKLGPMAGALSRFKKGIEQ